MSYVNMLFLILKSSEVYEIADSTALHLVVCGDLPADLLCSVCIQIMNRCLLF
jgi:hypothetical protein